jgi:purine-binding chemotaxis protein CheW
MYAEHVREIIPIAASVKIPGQPSTIEGFLDFRGAILPMVRLAALFELAFVSSASSPVIVARISGSEIGLLVDGVDDLLTIEAGELHPVAANHSANEYANAGFFAGNREYVLIDANRLLLAEERTRILELESQVKRRQNSIGAVQT